MRFGFVNILLAELQQCAPMPRHELEEIDSFQLNDFERGVKQLSSLLGISGT